MAITLADFNKIWASTSPLTPYSFTESNYKQGWNFVGATPPARQMWDSVQKQNDEKMQFIVNNMLVPVDVDETNASGNYYNTSVPSDKVFANFNTIGGKTVAWNQIEPNPTTVYTSSGLHYLTTGQQIVAGHKYFVKDTFEGTAGADTSFAVYVRVSGTNKVTIKTAVNEPKRIVTAAYSGTSTGHANQDGDCWVYVELSGATSLTNIQIIDLTLMFGAGNEPSTVAEFEAMFPASYYPYNAGTLLSAGADKVISKDSSNNVVATMPIPASVQALEGYGWSAGSVYNYVDFANKKFVQNVGRVDLGTLTWTYYAPDDDFYVDSRSWVKTPTSQPANALMPKYTLVSYQTGWNSQNNVYLIDNAGYFAIRDTNYGSSDAAQLKSDLSGVYLYYELKTPIETDISDLLGADGIACESGGSLTFENSNGDNYRIPVPVNLDWLDGTDGLMTVQDKGKLEVAYKASEVDNSIPAGVVQAFAGNNTPNGWLLCDGSAVSRVMYSALFNVIGTTYGVGDGSTTFNLPDLVDKFVEGGSTAGVTKVAGLPNIKGFTGFFYSGTVGIQPLGSTGAFANSGDWGGTNKDNSLLDQQGNYKNGVTFDASRSSAIYSDDVTTVQPPALTMRYIIKY